LALETTQSELLELKNKFDEDAHAKSSELDLLVVDLERAHQVYHDTINHTMQSIGGRACILCSVRTKFTFAL
jgi:hypothetical protein